MYGKEDMGYRLKVITLIAKMMLEQFYVGGIAGNGPWELPEIRYCSNSGDIKSYAPSNWRDRRSGSAELAKNYKLLVQPGKVAHHSGKGSTDMGGIVGG